MTYWVIYIRNISVELYARNNIVRIVKIKVANIENKEFYMRLITKSNNHNRTSLLQRQKKNMFKTL